MASLYDILTVENEQYYRMNKNIVPKDKVPKDILKSLTPTNVIDENGMVVVDEKAGPAQEPTEENLKEIANPTTPAAPKVGTEDPSDDEDDNSDEDSEPDIDDSDDEDDTDDDSKKQPPAAPDQKAEEKAPAKPARTATTPTVATFKSSVPQSRPGMGFPRANGKTVDIFDGKTPHTHLKLVDGVAVPLSEDSFRTRNDLEIRNRLAELGIATIDFSEIEAKKAAVGAGSNAGNVDSLMLDESESDDSPTED